MIVVGIDPSFTALGISCGTSHAVLSAPEAIAGEERANSTRRRAFALASITAGWIMENAFPLPIPVGAHVPRDPLHVYIEAPMLSSQGGGANHLYELGWLMAALYAEIESSFGDPARVYEVPTATVRKFVAGKGNVPKAQFPLAVYKRWGIEFERDRGADMAFAFALQRYGEACERGEIERVFAQPRGRGLRERNMKRAMARGAA